MKRCDSAAELRAIVAEWREAGDTIALVPTMGNLHKGHLSLVDLAADQAERVIVSVFVNPTQFGPDDDFDDYPRTLDVDARRLSRAGVDLLFAPTVETMYPHGAAAATSITVPEVSEGLEGEHRPGHFAGVCSVVCRLFNLCSPNVAVFGQKDFQQFAVLQRMVDDLHFPIRLLLGPTEREASGLAMSSRNGYLDAPQKDKAAIIYTALRQIEAGLARGKPDFAALEKEARDIIAAAGLEPEYVAIRGIAGLGPPGESSSLVILAAARLGRVRLIDNLQVDLVS